MSFELLALMSSAKKNPFIPELDDYLWDTEPSVIAHPLYREVRGEYKIEPAIQHVLVIAVTSFEELSKAANFLRQMALWKAPDIRIIGVAERIYSFASATAYFAENSEGMRVIVLKRRRFRHPDFANLGQTKILVDRRFALLSYLD